MGECSSFSLSFSSLLTLPGLQLYLSLASWVHKPRDTYLRVC